jgi:hypothetical protein
MTPAIYDTNLELVNQSNCLLELTTNSKAHVLFSSTQEERDNFIRKKIKKRPWFDGKLGKELVHRNDYSYRI